MYEILRYAEEDFEKLFKKINNLEDKVLYWSNRTNRQVTVDTKFFYNREDEIWEGEFTVSYEKEI
jgi:hypothetical protein